MRTAYIVTALWLALAVSAAEASLIQNGSFEAPLVAAGTQGAFGDGEIPFWSVLSDDVTIISTSYVEGPTFNAQSGIQSVDLSGFTNTTANGLSQTVDTALGKQYELSFYVGRADEWDPINATVDLSINGGTRQSFINTGLTSGGIHWQLFTVSFTATSDSTSIAFYNGNPVSNFVSGLDNVSLDVVSAEVPEPATLTIWGLGALGCAVAAFRRRKVLT